MLVFDGEHAAHALAFTPDGTRLVAARYPGAVDVWTLASGERVAVPLPDEGSRIYFLMIQPAGWTLCAVAGGPLTVVSLADHGVRSAAGVLDVRKLVVSPDGRWVVAVHARDGGYQLAGYRCDPGLRFDAPPTWELPVQSRWEETGPFLGPGELVTLSGHTLAVREAATGRCVRTVRFPAHHPRCFAVSPDGRRLAVMGYDKLYLWDTATWGEPTRVSGLNRWIDAMAFHPTRPIILTAQDRLSLVKYLDADTGKPVRKFDWKLGIMRSVAFSPDGTLAAAGSDSGKIVVWDVDE